MDSIPRRASRGPSLSGRGRGPRSMGLQVRRFAGAIAESLGIPLPRELTAVGGHRMRIALGSPFEAVRAPEAQVLRPGLLKP